MAKVGWEQRAELSSASICEKMRQLLDGLLMSREEVLAKMKETKGQVLLFSKVEEDCIFFEGFCDLWIEFPGLTRIGTGHWANTNDASVLASETEIKLSEKRNDSHRATFFRECSFVLTPTAKDFFFLVSGRGYWGS